MLKVGILGSGNIGCDLLMKVKRSDWLDCTLFMGRNPDSKGMRFACRQGVNVSSDSIRALEANPGLCDLVFDATTAAAHIETARILKRLGVMSVDLTPSLVGRMCVPLVNGMDCIGSDDVNMITCGGQATIPVVHAISKVVPSIKYIEIVAGISSDSAGPGTRANIDEFTQTTKKALSEFTGVQNTKAIIILNPARPPILMHNTIYIVTRNATMEKVSRAVADVQAKMREYLPGYSIINGPAYYDGKIVVMVQLEGSGDYLPRYSGNLDVITSAAVKFAEMYARARLR